MLTLTARQILSGRMAGMWTVPQETDAVSVNMWHVSQQLTEKCMYMYCVILYAIIYGKWPRRNVGSYEQFVIIGSRNGFNSVIWHNLSYFLNQCWLCIINNQWRYFRQIYWKVEKCTSTCNISETVESVLNPNIRQIHLGYNVLNLFLGEFRLWILGFYSLVRDLCMREVRGNTTTRELVEWNLSSTPWDVNLLKSLLR